MSDCFYDITFLTIPTNTDSFFSKYLNQGILQFLSKTVNGELSYNFLFKYNNITNYSAKRFIASAIIVNSSFPIYEEIGKLKIS